MCPIRFASIASAGSALWSLVGYTRCFPLSFVASASPASAGGISLSPVASVSCLLLSSIASADTAGETFASAGGVSASAGSAFTGNTPSSLVVGGSSSSLVSLAGSQELFLPNTLFFPHRFSLLSLPLFHSFCSFCLYRLSVT